MIPLTSHSRNVEKGQIVLFFFLTSLAFTLLPGSILAKTDTFHLDKKFQVDINGTISISSSDAEVKITGSNRSDVHVIVNYVRKIKGSGKDMSSGRFEVIVNTEKGNLNISDRHPNLSYVGSVTIVTEKYEILVDAPKSMNLHLLGDDDDYTINNMAAAVSLKMDGGNALISNVSGDVFNFDIGDGTVKMNRGRGSLKANVQDGSIIIDNGDFSSVTAKAEDGNLNIKTKIHDSGRYEFHTNDGDILLSVLAGGGEFAMEYEDGDVEVSSGFERKVAREGYHVVRLPGGHAEVFLSTKDGSINLQKR